MYMYNHPNQKPIEPESSTQLWEERTNREAIQILNYNKKRTSIRKPLD